MLVINPGVTSPVNPTPAHMPIMATDRIEQSTNATTSNAEAAPSEPKVCVCVEIKLTLTNSVRYNAYRSSIYIRVLLQSLNEYTHRPFTY
jgi:hypothetical protein